MPVVTCAIENLYVARVTEVLDRTVYDLMFREIGTLGAKLKRPPVVLYMTSKGVEPPSADMRKYLMERGGDFLARIASAYIVVEGEGVGSMLLRTVTRGIITFVRGRLDSPAPMLIFGSVREALVAAAPELSTTPDEAHRVLVAKGLVAA